MRIPENSQCPRPSTGVLRWILGGRLRSGGGHVKKNPTTGANMQESRIARTGEMEESMWWALPAAPAPIPLKIRPPDGLPMASDGSGSDQRGLRPMEGTIGRFSDDYGTVLDLVRLCPKPHSHSGEKQEKRNFTDVFRSALIGLLIRWSWVRVPAASLGITTCRRLGLRRFSVGGGGGPEDALLAKLLPDASKFLGRDASNAAQVRPC